MEALFLPSKTAQPQRQNERMDQQKNYQPRVTLTFMLKPRLCILCGPTAALTEPHTQRSCMAPQRSPTPISCSEKGQEQQVTHSWAHLGFEHLQGWRALTAVLPTC